MLAAQPGLKIVVHTAAALTQFRVEARAAGCVDFLVKPIRAAQVYECLRAHLGVAFEYVTPGAGSQTPGEWVAGHLELSEELYARLTTAAELHSTTALKGRLQELRQLGPEAGVLAEHIRHLMRSYDMDGIMRLILRARLFRPCRLRKLPKRMDTKPLKIVPREKILLVDDQPANLTVLSAALEPEGYQILAAPNGLAALKVAARALPALILLDVMMPNLDGLETCRR